MIASFLDPATSAALWITLKASVLLGIAAIMQAVMSRRTSAAMRHLVWTLAIVGVLLLPILSLALPEWVVVIRTAATKVADATPAVDGVEESAALARPSASLAENAEPAPVLRPLAGISSSSVIASIYAAGMLVMLIRLTMQRWTVRRLAHEATDLRDEEWTRLLRESAASMGVRRPVRLLRSRECTMPMAFGTRRPAILIPATADTWPEDRRRAVVLHELAHVARYDCLTQSLAFAACTMYWFHPAAWWISRRLRIERELACDDRVIAAGAQAREYAGHLLEIAYSLGSQRAPALAVSMARPRQLEGRMRAVLDLARNRSVPAVRMRVAGAVIAAALLLPLASATSTVVAGQPEPDRTPAAAAPVPARQYDPAVAPLLEPLEAQLTESARRIVRAAAAAIGIPQDRLPGTWEIRPTKTEGTVHLRLVELNSSSGSNIPIQQLEGLTAAQLTGAGGPVQFRLRRDAGTFSFEGVVRNGIGAGTFSFSPDSSFPEELAKRGFARPTALEQYQLARHDLGYAFVDELNKQGYAKPQTSELVRAGQHGVHVAYLRDMAALGYRLGTLEPLIRLRDHGVTPAYIRELSDQGYRGLPADDLRRARDHGISPEYVRAMRDAGYRALTMEQLINARDHGVTAEFIRALDEAGHRKLPLDQLIRARDHGVSPEYAREMRQLGYGVPIDELIRGRDHGVDVEFVRGMASLGYSGLPLESLVRLRDHGVTPKYVQELKALGYDRVPVDDLVTLRDHGLTADRIRSANARAGTRLPVDLLKRLAAGGMK
ncbi:MAG: M56 family metallopeptidase [Acidobacteria bacterium]|nr:M56 family metallopeptidase [Acidobacteriota bacterium]